MEHVFIFSVGALFNSPIHGLLDFLLPQLNQLRGLHARGHWREASGGDQPTEERKKKQNHTQWHMQFMMSEWSLCVHRRECISVWMKWMVLEAKSWFIFFHLKISAECRPWICTLSTCLPVWRIQFHLASPHRSPPPPPLPMTPHLKAPVLPTVCDPPPPPPLWPDRKQKPFSSFCKEAT